MNHSAQLPIFVLNMDRNPERLAAISKKLDGLGLSWERMPAIDARTAPESDLARFVDPTGPIYSMGQGARACTAGHFLMWQKLLQTEAPAAIILEDDVDIAPELAYFVSAPALAPLGTDVIKLEIHRMHHAEKTLAIGRKVYDFANGISAARLLSVHYGTGAYLITRKAAEYLVNDLRRTNMPVDHLLFNPNVSAFARRREILQAYPAIAQQAREVFESQIVDSGAKRTGTRERLKRLYFEVRQVPIILLMLLAGQARILKLTFIKDTQDQT